MKKIMIVDDQENILRLVEAILHSEDREFIFVKNGQKAVELAHSQKPDLIIMDVVMPGDIDGMEAVKIIKSDPDARDCPILILTAKKLEGERERAFEMGASDYILKPFGIDYFKKKVEAILN